MMNFINFVISAVVFMSTFFWAMDAVVHQKKTRVVACIISVLTFLAWGICLAVLTSS